jgi:hypothetical protein
MKKLILYSCLTALFCGSAFALGPRVYCQSEDGKIEIRTEPNPWGSGMQAKVYHNGAMSNFLKTCESAGEYALYCIDEQSPPRKFYLESNLDTGRYHGTREITYMNCRFIRQEAE